MKLTGIFQLLLVLLIVSQVAAAAEATEVYRWVDDDGVIHFSQNEPSGKDATVEKITLEDTTPPDYDPEEDLYGVQALAEEMTVLREEMAEKREQARERQLNAPQQPVVQNQQSGQYGYPYYGRPPYYPGLRPPVRPEPPRPEPYPSFPFRPPGRN
jgi:hypothetical protein